MKSLLEKIIYVVLLLSVVTSSLLLLLNMINGIYLLVLYGNQPLLFSTVISIVVMLGSYIILKNIKN